MNSLNDPGVLRGLIFLHGSTSVVTAMLATTMLKMLLKLFPSNLVHGKMNVLHPWWCPCVKVTLPPKQLRFYFAASENHSSTHYKLVGYIPMVMLLNWLNLGGILLDTFCDIFPKNLTVVCWSDILLVISLGWLGWLAWNKKEVDVGPTLWPWPLTSPMTLTLCFQVQIFE